MSLYLPILDNTSTFDFQILFPIKAETQLRHVWLYSELDSKLLQFQSELEIAIKAKTSLETDKRELKTTIESLSTKLENSQNAIDDKNVLEKENYEIIKNLKKVYPFFYLKLVTIPN